VTAAGRRRVGKRSAFAPGGRCSGISARAARSAEKKSAGAAVADEFLPLLAPVVAAPRPPVPLCEVRVGSVVVPFASLPVTEGCPVVSAPMLGTKTWESIVRGGMAAYHPLVDAEVVGLPVQPQQLQCGAASGLAGPSSVRSWPSSSSAQLIRPFCITILYHNLLLFIDIFHI
jgi:hypothetical protein